MSDLGSSAVQVLLSFFVFLVGMIFVLSLRRLFDTSSSRVLLLYFWHTFFSLISFRYIIDYGGDAIAYYRYSFSPDLNFSFGTAAVEVLTSFLTQGVGLSFFGCFLVFQIFGAVGLIAFDASLREVTSYKSRGIRLLATAIIFLPSISFWSSALGKDALSFFAMGLALWTALDLKKRWFLLIISMLVMLLVRPHIAGMMGLGLAGSFVFQKRIPLLQRVVLGSCALLAAAALVPIGLNYAGVGAEANASDLIEFIEGRQGHNLKGGGAVDISSMSPPVQMFTYLFRPTLIEVRNPFSAAAALDNTILLFLFLAGGWALIRKPLPTHVATHNRMFLWIYSLLAWLILAMTTANLGIALRQKWMFAPMLIFLLISVIGRPRVRLEPVQPSRARGRR